MIRRLSFFFLLVSLGGSCLAQAYRKGYYYSPDGQRMDGLFKHLYKAHWGTGTDNTFSFKPTKNGQKQVLTTKDVKGLVIEKDSFTVVKNIRLSETTAYNEDFVEVVKTGKINLFKHYSDSGSAGTRTINQTFTYLIEKDGKLMILGRKEFTSKMVNLVSDNLDLQKKIHQRELKFDQVAEVVHTYNPWYEQQKRR